MKIKSLTLITALSLTMVFCKTPGGATGEKIPAAVPQPLIIYKTTANYDQNVPISISSDGNEITGYPAPADLKKDGKLRTPSRTSKGYLVDNRGIGPQTAFISLTYAEYSKLPAPPAASELMKMIVDKHPIAEMWRCKRQGSDSLNMQYARELIGSGRLNKECTPLK